MFFLYIVLMIRVFADSTAVIDLIMFLLQTFLLARRSVDQLSTFDASYLIVFIFNPIFIKNYYALLPMH